MTVTATTHVTVRRLLPGLGAFRVRNPTMDLRLHASDELVDLGTGLAEIAVRYGSGPFDGLVTEPLLAEQFGVLCSPTLNLSHRDQLKRSTLLHTEWKRTEKAPDWRRWFRLAGIIDSPSDQGPRFMEDDHALQAAIAGYGVVIGSLVLAKSEIEAGFPVNPFGPVIEGEVYHVAATPENMACADVQAVRDWLRETVA